MVQLVDSRGVSWSLDSQLLPTSEQVQSGAFSLCSSESNTSLVLDGGVLYLSQLPDAGGAGLGVFQVWFSQSVQKELGELRTETGRVTSND